MSRPVMRRSASGGSPKPTAQDAGGGGGFEPRPASQAAGDQEYDYVRAVPLCSGVGLARLCWRVGSRQTFPASCACSHSVWLALPSLADTSRCLVQGSYGGVSLEDAVGDLETQQPATQQEQGYDYGDYGGVSLEDCMAGVDSLTGAPTLSCYVLSDAFAGWWLISMVVAQSKSWTRRRLRSASAAARPA